MADIPQPTSDALVEFQGRNFSAFGIQHMIHCAPIDETKILGEADASFKVAEGNYDDVDEMFAKLLGGRILIPDLDLETRDDPAILDCGYGKGSWIDRVLSNCSSNVMGVGIDIFTGHGDGTDSDEGENDNDDAEWVKIRWNLNASFKESRNRYLKPESFDLINSRFLADGINKSRWGRYVKELNGLLVPRGWLQMVEPHLLFQSDAGRDTGALQRWWEWYESALHTMQKEPRIGRQLEQLMKDAGFERVHYEVKRLPIGRWMRGQEAVGDIMLAVMHELLRASSQYPFLQICKMPPEQYVTLIHGAQQVLRQPEMKLYLNTHVAYGRKPKAAKAGRR